MKNNKIFEIKNRFKIFFDEAKKEENINGIFYIKDNIEAEENNLIRYINCNFKEFYKNSIILGEGTLGLVKKTVCQKTKLEYAVKIIRSRDEEIIYQLKEEFNNIIKLKHENIIKVKELLIDKVKGKIYLIMEYFNSVEMFKFIADEGHYDQNLAKHLFKQLLIGMEYLHSNGIIHRDLKPNNLLVSLEKKILKIADFNIAKFFDTYNDYDKLKKDNYKMLTYTGTWAFNAPEKFEKNYYTEWIDCWSAGCILYTMLIGKQPFYKEHVADLINQIKKNDYDKISFEYLNLSEKARNLIENLLQTDPKNRLSPKQALNHSWFECDYTNNLNNCVKKMIKNRKSLIRNDCFFNRDKQNTISFTKYIRNSIDLHSKKIIINNLEKFN